MATKTCKPRNNNNKSNLTTPLRKIARTEKS